MILRLLFWFFLIVIGYTYFGYTLLLYLFRAFKMTISRHREKENFYEPSVSVIIPAYNEGTILHAKVNNCNQLDYPREKLQILWITDGSQDDSPAILKQLGQSHILHSSERKGKSHAINRAVQAALHPILLLTDANSMLNPESLRKLVTHFSDPSTGCVAGEKRIETNFSQKAVGAGEGLYWQYESLIKYLESETGSVLGAAGELFAVRKALFHPVQEDCLLDDFTISMQIAAKGYTIKYAPGAWSMESASLSVKEELKRKVRIATGGFQFLFRNPSLLNPLSYGMLTFKYISHKVLRWLLVPPGLLILLITNVLIISQAGFHSPFYNLFFAMQCVFYAMAAAGVILKNTVLKFRIFFIPYYILVMNYAVLAGFISYCKGNYSPLWPKAKR